MKKDPDPSGVLRRLCYNTDLEKFVETNLSPQSPVSQKELAFFESHMAGLIAGIAKSIEEEREET